MKRVLLFFLGVAVVAATSSYVTFRLCDSRPVSGPAGTHAWLHDELHLTTEQEKALEPIESRFAAEHERLANEIAHARKELSRAILEEKAYGPRVTTAVETVHERMGEMKRASIRHVFEMQSVLSPEQSEELLRLAQKSLEQSH